MTKLSFTSSLLERLKSFLKSHPKAELVDTYLFFLERKSSLKPVIFPKEKRIYQSVEVLIKKLENQGGIWKETEIKISFSKDSVNAGTQKIYICPFTGKVFGDNTHPNPQDAIYDWVSKCPENTERSGGLRVKRFFISEDSEVIQEYASKEKRRKPITKVVYSSAINSKLFNSKEAVIKDFRKHYIKPISLVEVPNQNRFEIEDEFLAFIQAQLQEDKIAAFVEELSNHEDFLAHVSRWVESDDDEDDTEESV